MEKLKVKKLKVKSIRYFKTNRGLGYKAKTNVTGLEILNDGQGGGTYLDGAYSLRKPFENVLSVRGVRNYEQELEELLNVYERSIRVAC